MSIQTLFAQIKTYTIEATIHGINDGSRFFLRKNSSGGGTDTVHRIIVKNGKFKVTGNQPIDPELYFLFVEGNKNYLPLLLENQTFQIKGDIQNWPYLIVVGPEQNTEYHSMWNIFDKDLNEIKSLADSIIKYYKPSDSLIVRKFENRRKLVMSKFYNTTIPPLIKSHPNSIFTPLMIRVYSEATIVEKWVMYNQLSVHSQQSKYGRELLRDLAAKEKIEVSLKKNTAPDFLLPMPVMGKTMSLKDFVAKSKLVYIDFWASWCTPCRAQFPELKNTFSRFKGQGFNILGISIDKNENAWKKAVAEENLVWENVCDVKGINSEVALLYNLVMIPRSVLVDSMGKIIAQNIHGKELANKIEAYLKSNPDIK